jgi:hypothetical protein
MVHPSIPRLYERKRQEKAHAYSKGIMEGKAGAEYKPYSDPAVADKLHASDLEAAHKLGYESHRASREAEARKVMGEGKKYGEE